MLIDSVDRISVAVYVYTCHLKMYITNKILHNNVIEKAKY